MKYIFLMKIHSQDMDKWGNEFLMSCVGSIWRKHTSTSGRGYQIHIDWPSAANKWIIAY